MADQVERGLRKAGISVSRPVLAVICIIFGILLLIFPELVGYIIGIFLLIQGILILVEVMDTDRRGNNYPRNYSAREPTPPPPPPPPQTET
jgi:uncharacterized membrane protein HdeD (DUF308 family)